MTSSTNNKMPHSQCQPCQESNGVCPRLGTSPDTVYSSDGFLSDDSRVTLNRSIDSAIIRDMSGSHEDESNGERTTHVADSISCIPSAAVGCHLHSNDLPQSQNGASSLSSSAEQPEMTHDCSSRPEDGGAIQKLIPPDLTEPQQICWRMLRRALRWTPFIQSYKQLKYPWVQLAGHEDHFRPGEHGTILKKFSSTEYNSLRLLRDDILRPFVPEFVGIVELDNEQFLQIQDLLALFETPSLMDCKMGVRTYLEEELVNARKDPQPRNDMYLKMIEVDADEPTEEEHQLQSVTKPRYMIWRETISSTATLGFRVEGIKKKDGYSSREFKTTKNEDQVYDILQMYTDKCPTTIGRYIERLRDLREHLVKSHFFHSHEIIGSSLLFVHDESNAGVWMIDFGKCQPAGNGRQLGHDIPWIEGSQEDGYILGLDHLVRIFRRLHDASLAFLEKPSEQPDERL